MDVALCELALQQEAASYRWLAARLPQGARWVVTPLSRTRATAAAIFAAGYAPAPLEVEPDLAEQHLGDWQGVSHERFAELIRHPAHPFWPHAAEEKPPGGESFAEVVVRVSAVLDRLVQDTPGRDIVIVAHGGSIRAAVAQAMGLSPHQALIFSVRNLSMTRLERHGMDWRVAAVNEEPFTLPATE